MIFYLRFMILQTLWNVKMQRGIYYDIAACENLEPSSILRMDAISYLLLNSFFAAKTRRYF